MASTSCPPCQKCLVPSGEAHAGRTHFHGLRNYHFISYVTNLEAQILQLVQQVFCLGFVAVGPPVAEFLVIFSPPPKKNLLEI